MYFIDYTDSEGFKWVLLTEDPSIPIHMYSSLPVVGPPNLAELVPEYFTEDQVREIQGQLADKRILNAEMMMGRRGEVLKIVEKMGLDGSTFERVLRSFYQKTYYGY